MRRILGILLAAPAVLGASPAARAAELIATVARPTPIGAIDGRIVWSDYDPGLQDVFPDPARRRRDVAAAGPATLLPFDLDLGPDGDGKPVARPARAAGEIRHPANPPRGAIVQLPESAAGPWLQPVPLLDPHRAGGPRTVRRLARGLETLPTVWTDRVAFARRYERRGAAPAGRPSCTCSPMRGSSPAPPRSHSPASGRPAQRPRPDRAGPRDAPPRLRSGLDRPAAAVGGLPRCHAQHRPDRAAPPGPRPLRRAARTRVHRAAVRRAGPRGVARRLQGDRTNARVRRCWLRRARPEGPDSAPPQRPDPAHPDIAGAVDGADYLYLASGLVASDGRPCIAAGAASRSRGARRCSHASCGARSRLRFVRPTAHVGCLSKGPDSTSRLRHHDG